MAGKPAAALHVGYAPSLTVEVLPDALREFERAFPGTAVTLHDFSTTEMLSGLLDHSLDLALMIRPTQGLPASLICLEVRRYAVAVAMPPEHRLATGPAPTLVQVLSERRLSYARDGYPEYCNWLDTMRGGSHQKAEEYDSSTSLLAAVAAGRGLALVPQCFCCFAGSRLVVRALEEPLDPFVLVAAVRAGASPLVMGFLQAVRGENRIPGPDRIG